MSRVTPRLVIVGAGQAAAQAIHSLRAYGYDGSIVLIGDEPLVPYQRPPLSKRFLTREWAQERLLLRPMHFYTDNEVELLLGRRVRALALENSRVCLDHGETVPYDRLLLATGSRPRRPQLPGIDLEGVHYLRTLLHAEQLRSELVLGRRLLVLGGGYIGLEVAATAMTLGLEVVVLEAAPRIMSRVVCPEISAFFSSEHRRHGVQIKCSVKVQALESLPGTSRVGAVKCEDGSRYPADVVLVGVGCAPDIEIAASAGLECSNGIIVDEYCRTSADGVYAAGDCTNHPSLRYGSRVRLESVDNACEQATSAAFNLVGRLRTHDRVPWFWSDQFDLKLVIVGLAHSAGHTVLRGDPESRCFSVCYQRGDELVAIDTVNRPKDHLAARKLIAARARLSATRLAQADIPLADCVA